MQTLDWYYRRLKVMSPGEIAWRTRSSLRDRADRFLVGRRQQLRKPSAILNGNGNDKGPSFRVSDMAVGDRAWLNTNDEVEKWWYDSLMARAGRIAEHQIDLFNLRDKHLGDPFVWCGHHKCRKAVGNALIHLINKRAIYRLKKFVVNKN